MLYACVAFHEYKDNTFWPQFCQVIGLNSRLSTNRQRELNENFAKTAGCVGLRIIKHKGGRSFVGSAVYYIGVPISLWDEFLYICEWALWHPGWADFSDSKWAMAMEKRCGGWKRLLKFLTDNRQAATEFIQEMLDARKMLTEDNQLELSAIRQASILRPEYFEEVPETAEFLRPNNPDSLLENHRPRLLWRDNRIAIHLPPVSPTEVNSGAAWHFEGKIQPASDSATELPVNGKVFQERLTLELHNRSTESFRFAGLCPFGLWDEEINRFVNTNRAHLPARPYRLISRERLKIMGKGWAKDDEEKTENVPHSLMDGTEVFITNLWPVDDRPTLKIDGRKIEFGRRESVKLRLYSGSENSSVCRFLLRESQPIEIEQNPHLVLEIPEGFVEDEADLCDREFKILADRQQVPVKWQFFHNYPKENPDWEYYQCQPKMPTRNRKKCIMRSLEFLRLPEESSSSVSLGEHVIQVCSRRAGVIPLGRQKEFRVKLIPPIKEDCWPKPRRMGKYLLWILLSQIQHDATWENFWIARQAVAGYSEIKLSQNDWKKLERHGYISLYRGRFEVLKSCLVFALKINRQLTARYCGLVNRLHALVREVQPLGFIESKQERGFPAHLEIQWPAHKRQFIYNLCQREDIIIKEHSLWNH